MGFSTEMERHGEGHRPRPNLDLAMARTKAGHRTMATRGYGRGGGMLESDWKGGPAMVGHDSLQREGTRC